tara:strand:+ start:995 stop:1252 length:258 start_codon:yes stop_codon:yes gene_type:complete
MKTKKEIIKYLSKAKTEFSFMDEGVCTLSDKGVILKHGTPCRVELNGGWDNVVANLNYLPKKYATACLNSYQQDWSWMEWLEIDG